MKQERTATQDVGPRSTNRLDLHILMLSRFGRNDGGRETWLYEFVPRLLRMLPAARVSVFGIGGDDDPPIDRHIEECARDVRERFSINRFHVRRTRWPLVVSMTRSLWHHTRKLSFDAPGIVLGMGVFELPMIFFPAYKDSVRCVWLRSIFVHEKAHKIPRWILPSVLRIEKELLRRVDCVLANGHDIAEFYKNMGLDVIVIENGVDTKRWALEARPRIRERIQVAFIGRLAKVKGIDEYLEAVNELATTGSDKFVFHIVGGGAETYAANIRALGEQVRYHGVLSNSELPKFLTDIDVCVALTWADPRGGGGGTSNALFEQMAAGRIIVAWDNVIFRAVLDDTCAYLVPQGDVGALVAAFREIESHPDEARRRAKNAFERAQQHDIHDRVRMCVSVLNGLIRHEDVSLNSGS